MIRTLMRNRLAESTLAVLVIFYVSGLVFLQRRFFLELLNGMLCAITLVVSVTYSRDIPDRLRVGRSNIVLIRIGIVLGWATVSLQSVARIVQQELRPVSPGRTFDVLLGSPGLLLIIAASLHMIAIGTIERGDARMLRNIRMVILSLVSGASLVIAAKLATLLS